MERINFQAIEEKWQNKFKSLNQFTKKNQKKNFIV